jgi:hypothetical protein
MLAATILARIVSNSGMSNTNATLVVFSAIVATVCVRRAAVPMRAMSVEAVKE